MAYKSASESHQDDLEGRIHVAQMKYLDGCKAIVMCSRTSADDLPCAEGFLSILVDGHWIASKCSCLAASASASRELKNLGRQWWKQAREEYDGLFPYVSEELRARWRAEKRADERRPDNPERIKDLMRQAARILGAGMEVEHEVSG